MTRMRVLASDVPTNSLFLKNLSTPTNRFSSNKMSVYLYSMSKLILSCHEREVVQRRVEARLQVYENRVSKVYLLKAARRSDF